MVYLIHGLVSFYFPEYEDNETVLRLSTQVMQG